MGEHPALVARHTREGIQAKLEAAIEQVRFDAAQEKRVADQKVGQAEAAVVDAAQRLRILGVSENIQSLLDRADHANAISRDEDVTFYRIVAPFDGTIIMRSAVPSQRAEPTDALFRAGRSPLRLGLRQSFRVGRRQVAASSSKRRSA